MMSRAQEYDLRQGSFRAGWATFLPQVRAQPYGDENECSRCRMFVQCGQCPGWATMENGDPKQRVEYLCQIAHRRVRH